ncbi:MAG TPA: metallophosphoesterase [Chloroflexi bacterium]|mgnify:CR=1 FL=1|nr:metallophosphoesterase [Chloroflexota bacterium]
MTTTIGLLSDTHIPHRMPRLPDAVFDALTGVDMVLHAGDVDDPAALLPLQDLAPVHAVRGNIHLTEFSDGGAILPAVIELSLTGYRLVLTHGHRPGLLGLFTKGISLIGRGMGLVSTHHFNQHIAHRLARLYTTADVIVFGHTHMAHVEYVGSTLLINPGAVCPNLCPGVQDQQSVARLYLDTGKPDVEIIPIR